MLHNSLIKARIVLVWFSTIIARPINAGPFDVGLDCAMGCEVINSEHSCVALLSDSINPFGQDTGDSLLRGHSDNIRESLMS